MWQSSRPVVSPHPPTPSRSSPVGLPRIEQSLLPFRMSGGGGKVIERVGQLRCPTLSKKSSPSLAGVDRRRDVPHAARDEAYSETWTERTSPQLTRFIRLLIPSSQGGLKFEGWGEQGSPHPSKDSSPPPGRIPHRRTEPHAGGAPRFRFAQHPGRAGCSPAPHLRCAAHLPWRAVPGGAGVARVRGGGRDWPPFPAGPR